MNGEEESSILGVNSTNQCQSHESCVRFCCYDSSTCLDKDYLNISAISEASNLNKNYKVLKGKPCKEMFVEDSWAFLSVSTKLLS